MPQVWKPGFEDSLTTVLSTRISRDLAWIILKACSGDWPLIQKNLGSYWWPDIRYNLPWNHSLTNHADFFTHIDIRGPTYKMNATASTVLHCGSSWWPTKRFKISRLLWLPRKENSNHVHYPALSEGWRRLSSWQEEGFIEIINNGPASLGQAHFDFLL